MEEKTELATSLQGDVYQRIPGEKNLWTMIQTNHSFSSALGERFYRVKRLGIGTDTVSSAVQEVSEVTADHTDISCLSAMGRRGSDRSDGTGKEVLWQKIEDRECLLNLIRS